MIFTLAIAAAQFSLLLAQAPVCNRGPSIPTFNNCVRDTLTDANGQVGPTDPSSACASLVNDQQAYYKCLCDKSTGVSGW